MAYRVVVTLFGFLFISTAAGYEGESCVKDNKPGFCKVLSSCKAAIADRRNKIPPQICGFSGVEPIVCCLDASIVAIEPPPRATTQRQKVTTTTEYLPPLPDYEVIEETPHECPPIPVDRTSKKTGRKAWDKCIEYQETLVYPCEKTVVLTGSKSRTNNCLHGTDVLVVGGENANYGEFPHSVLLGYGDKVETAAWKCGGTLISERFILTAGHCTSSHIDGKVAFARLSLLKRSDPISSAIKRVYDIEKIIKHPNYKPPSVYNDIALLRTTTDMLLDRFAVPACIHTGNTIRDQKAVATGWGLLKYKGKSSEVLQKVTLTKFTTQECREYFTPAKNVLLGYQEATQICYGDKKESKDTCQGDSGGPLLIQNADVHCMYTVIGVTSFGKGCGYIGQPGVYTRVEAYADWVESVVWPTQTG